MSHNMKEVTDLTFQQEVLESSKVTVVDFWAPWCGPCRMVTPILEELANEYGDQVNITSLNTDSNPMTAMQLGIRSIPTIMLFKDGELKDTRIGAQPKKNFKEFIDKYLDT